MRMADVVVPGGIVEEVFAIRKKKRPAMRIVLSGVNVGDGGRLASGSRNAIQAGSRLGSEYYDATGTPASAAGNTSLAEVDGSSTVGGNALELAMCKEAEKTAVGRPEGPGGAFCAGQSGGLQRVEGLSIKLDFTGLAGYECDATAIGRDRNRSRRVAGRQERSALGWRDDPARARRGRRRGTGEKVKENCAD